MMTITKDIDINILFDKVFKNIVIFKNIYKFVKLYKKNECKRFKNRNELLEYKEREFIQKIIYGGNKIEINDLPNNCGVLKEVEFEDLQAHSFDGNVIPNGVEIITLPWVDNSYTNELSKISNYPSTVHTINNVLLQSYDDEFIECNKVSYNISKLTILSCPNISKINNDSGYVILPSNLKEVEFDYYWDNENIPFEKGDLPEGLLKLDITGYELKMIKSKEILPSTLKNLSIAFGNENNDDDDGNDNCFSGSFDVLPSNIESLEIDCYNNITVESKLNTLISLKEISIYFGGRPLIIEENSLPPNLTSLKLHYFDCKIDNKNIIPNTVTQLDLAYHIVERELSYLTANIPLPTNNQLTSLTLNYLITTPNTLPSSLTKLQYKDCYFDDPNPPIELLSALPQSLKYLTLNESLKKYNLNFPPTIKVDYQKR